MTRYGYVFEIVGTVEAENEEETKEKVRKIIEKDWNSEYDSLVFWEEK